MAGIDIWERIIYCLLRKGLSPEILALVGVDDGI